MVKKFILVSSLIFASLFYSSCSKTSMMRLEAANIAQERFTRKGFEVTVKAVGERNTVLVASSTLFNEFTVKRLKKVYMDDLVDLGFTRAYFFNPETTKTWIVELKQYAK